MYTLCSTSPEIETGTEIGRREGGPGVEKDVTGTGIEREIETGIGGEAALGREEEADQRKDTEDHLLDVHLHLVADLAERNHQF